MRQIIRLIIFTIWALGLSLFVIVNAHAIMFIGVGDDSGGAAECTWKVAWAATTATGDSTWGDYNPPENNRRTIIDASDLHYGGDSIRVVIQGHSAQASSTQGWSIGTRSGSTEDYGAAPTRITCSASSVCSTSAAGTVTSDNMSFTVSSTSSYLIHQFANDAVNNYEAYLDGTGAGYEDLTATDYTMTQDVTMSGYNFVSHLSQLEVCTTE